MYELMMLDTAMIREQNMNTGINSNICTFCNVVTCTMACNAHYLEHDSSLSHILAIWLTQNYIFYSICKIYCSHDVPTSFPFRCAVVDVCTCSMEVSKPVYQHGTVLLLQNYCLIAADWDKVTDDIERYFMHIYIYIYIYALTHTIMF